MGSRRGRRGRSQRRRGRRRPRLGLRRDDPQAAAPRRRAGRAGGLAAACDTGPAPPGAPTARRAASAASPCPLRRLLRRPRAPAQCSLLHQGAGPAERNNSTRRKCSL
uniref:Uncharacterized protein n=1 Tax=Arundo donax TaxID=35708 RepID=A0A0A9E017_ARUDO